MSSITLSNFSVRLSNFFKKMQVKELINLEAVVAKVKELTAKERDGKGEKMSEVAKQVTTILNVYKKDFGCVLLPVRRIVSAIIGEEIKDIDDSDCFPLGIVVVITKTWGVSCSYNEGDLVLIDREGSRVGLKTSGLLGSNNFPRYSMKDDNVRFATDGEIDKFFDLFDYEEGKSNLIYFCGRLAYY